MFDTMGNYSQIPGFWGHRIKIWGFVLGETGDLDAMGNSTILWILDSGFSPNLSV